MNNYTVYIHKNKINGKLYVGQTCQNPEKRWEGGKGYETSSKFYNAILKYGWDNFEHIIIDTNLTQIEANNLEENLIKTYKTQEDDFGYNIKAGGNNFKHSEETKRKIGEANKIALKGQHWSEERKQLMSEKFSGENNPFFGKHHSEESLEKISQNRKGKGGKRIVCLNTGEVFDCMMDAARWCGLKTSASIGQVCNKTGKQKTAGKHPVTGEKLYWEYYKEGDING